jgi:hypothetical protein
MRMSWLGWIAFAIRPDMESISMPMKRVLGFPCAMKLPTPQPGSRIVAESGTPKRDMASWMEAMTVGEV